MTSGNQHMMGHNMTEPKTTECCGRCWRERSGKYRTWAKRERSKFRRRDGKLFVLEGMANVYEEEACRLADMWDIFEDEMFDDYDDSYNYWERDEYPDERYHDGAYYDAEAEQARQYREEQAVERMYDTKYDAYMAGRYDAMMSRWSPNTWIS